MHKNIVEHLLYEALIAVGRKILQVEGHLGPCEISMLCFFKKTVNYEWSLPILEKIASQIFHRVRNIHQSVNQSINQWINIFFLLIAYITEQKMFYIKDFFSKCDQIHRKLRILSHLLRKFLMKNFSFCAVRTLYKGRDIFHFRVFSTYLVKDYLQNEKISLWYLPLNFPCMWTRWGNKHPLW